MPRRALVPLIIAAAALAVGCSKRARTVELDEVRFKDVIEKRFAAAVDTPRVNRRFDALIAEIMTDPSVGKAGEGLLATLADDPSLAASASAIMQQLGTQPAIVENTQALMRAHPEASADEIGALAGQQIATVTDGPIFSRAWDRAWNDLLKTPEMAAVMRRFGERMGRNQAFLDAMRVGVIAHVSDQRIADRLAELNGGEPPGRDKATDLLLAHAFSIERLAGFYDDVFGLPVVKREATALVRDLASSRAFQKQVAFGLRAMFEDPAVRDRAVGVMVVLMDQGVTEDELYRALQRLLTTPALRETLATMVDRMLDDEELAAIGGRALSHIVVDPEVQATLVKIFDGW